MLTQILNLPPVDTVSLEVLCTLITPYIDSDGNDIYGLISHYGGMVLTQPGLYFALDAVDSRTNIIIKIKQSEFIDFQIFIMGKGLDVTLERTKHQSPAIYFVDYPLVISPRPLNSIFNEPLPVDDF